VVVADPDVDSAKRVMAALTSWGLQPVLVHDGVEALLTIQLTLPRAAILDAALPKMYGFQICEMVKRNESLRTMHIVLVGSVHHQDRYRRPPTEMYGADAYMEKPDLPEGLRKVLLDIGYPVSDAPPQPSEPAAQPSVAPSPQSALIEPQPAAPPEVEPRVATPQPPPEPAPAPDPAPAADDGLADQRANAERLARIIVSDIVLYQPEQFEACVASGQLGDGLEAALSEGRGFFAQKVDSQVRNERDYIMEELQRVIRQRGGQ
jgi:CheY-like chemotaxis protein